MELSLCNVNMTRDNTAAGTDFNGSSGEKLYSNASSEFETLGPPTYMYVYVTVISSLVFLVGVMGNTLVIQVVIRIRSMRRRMNYFLVCLSVADLLVLLVALPSGLQEFYGKEKWFIGSTMCKMVLFLENTAHHSSVLTLLAIGFERYFAICHPLKVTIGARLSSEKLLIPLVWLLSCIATSPFAIFYDTVVVQFVDGTFAERCMFIGASKAFEPAYIIFIFTALFAVPIVLLTIMYSAISLTIATSSIPTSEMKPCSRNIGPSFRQLRGLEKGASCSTNKALSSRRQVIRVMIVIMCMYFVCLLPLRCLQLWTLYATQSDLISLGYEGYLNLLNSSRILVYIHSAGDPIIYGLLCSNFRAAFKKSFYNCRGSGRGGRGYKTTDNTLNKNTIVESQANPSNAIPMLGKERGSCINRLTQNGQACALRQTSESVNGNAAKRRNSIEEEIITELVTFDCSINGKTPCFV